MGRADHRAVRTALRLSIECSLWATALSVSSACRWRGCWRGSTSPGGALVRALCTLSMVLPPVVGGVALFFAFGRRGLVGQYLDRWFGIHAAVHHRRPSCSPQTFVAMPFLVLTVEARSAAARPPLRGRRPHPRARPVVRLPAGDPADRPAGARRRRRARAGPGPSASSAPRSRSPATSPARTQTMPLATYLALETDPEEAHRPQPACSSPCRSPCCSACASAGSAGPRAGPR